LFSASSTFVLATLGLIETFKMTQGKTQLDKRLLGMFKLGREHAGNLKKNNTSTKKHKHDKVQQKFNANYEITLDNRLSWCQ